MNRDEKKVYSSFKYHNYFIEGCGSKYELYNKDGMIGTFATCKQCKDYIERERNEKDELWNKSVLEEQY